MPEIDKWKLYRPFAPKRTKDTPPDMWKWDNSLGTLQYVENLDRMNGTVGVMAKSRKDGMVLRKALGIESICNVQAEDISALNDEVLYQIWANCKLKVIAADSDEKGKRFSWAMCTDHGYIHCNTPDHLLPEINDWADYGKEYGLKTVRKHWQQKGII